MPKTRSQRKSRDKGRFRKACGVRYHDDSLSPDEYELFSLDKNAKKIPKPIRDKLLSDGDIQPWTSYICSHCKNVCHNKISHNLNNSAHQPHEDCEPECANSSTSSAHKSDLNNTVDTDSCDIENADIELLKARVLSLIEQDVTLLHSQKNKCSLESLTNYRSSEWLQDRPNVVVETISQICGYAIEDLQNEQASFRVAKILEEIYKCRNSRIVLPLSFAQNLLTYSYSHSRKLIAYNACVSPGGSNTYLSQWLTEQSTYEVPFPKGFTKCVFDNQQVIGKTRTVKADNKVPSSVITSHCYISINCDDLIQNDPAFKPEQWIFGEITDEINESMKTEELEYSNLLRSTRNSFISSRIRTVTQQHKSADIDVIDELVEGVRKSKCEKICSDCGARNYAKLRMCSNCQGHLRKAPFDPNLLCSGEPPVNLYESFSCDVNQNEVKTVICAGEPDFVNPNSYENISQILRNLGRRAGIKQYGGTEREWLLLESDGAIYVIVQKLITNVLLCRRCSNSFYGIDSYNDHRCYILHQVEPKHEFAWILLQPGLLHIEMNACKSFIALCWDIFVCEAGKCLGFQSQKALMYLFKCSDHHKAMRMCEILYIALADELLTPYVRHCMSNGTDPSADGYWNWCQDIKNRNFFLVQQLAFTFLHGLMLFHSGVRNADSKALHAGLEKCSLMFFVRNHPRYRSIIINHKRMRALMPDQLRERLDCVPSYSRNNNVGHYQGGDAMLEEINKEAKSWISPLGVPTNANWQKIFRTLDMLNEVRDATLQAAGIKDCHSESSVKSESVQFREIAAVRELLRSNSYLLRPKEDKLITDVLGRDSLSEEILEITQAALTRFEVCKTGHTNDKFILPVTKIECDQQKKIENKTKSDIEKEIFVCLDQLDELSLPLYEERYRKDVRNKNKGDYIAFYLELMNVIDQSVAGEGSLDDHVDPE